ncbi:hypothetical protein M758_4G107900 [Ceratodon purpureus]|nr:hypothetical protein M758_4G107900 [Ceratodon purpureus]
MKTKIINQTSQVARIKSAAWDGSREFHKECPPGEFFYIRYDLRETYREYLILVGNHFDVFTSDNVSECKEIIIYETIEKGLKWRMSQPRGRYGGQQPLEPLSLQDLAAFNALIADASSRMGNVQTDCVSLRKLLDQVKICPFQCENLVETCSEVSEKLTEKYNAVPKNEMHQLFHTNRLSAFIGSLDRLLSTLGSIKGLLQACGREWCKMGLVLSIPPCEKRTGRTQSGGPSLEACEAYQPRLTKFGLLNDELCLNLDALYYALDLRKEMEFKWNDSRCRYVLVKKSSTVTVGLLFKLPKNLQSTGPGVPAVGELTESERLELEKKDRNHFLTHLEDQSLLVQEVNSWFTCLLLAQEENSLFTCLWPSRSEAIQKFSAVLKRRMQLICDRSIDTCAQDQSFSRIDHLDLEPLHKLSKGGSKLVYKGEWCGQVVAIAILKHGPVAAVQSEAALMLKVQHPHIVDFYGWAFTENVRLPPSSGEKDVVSAGYLVMECMERDLRSEIERCTRIRGISRGPFPPAVAVDILLQIVGAMIHMHSLGIMHHDLKALNCLVSLRSSYKSSGEVLDFYTVKLIDFGESKELKIDDMSLQTAKKGTSFWMAPEVKLPVGDAGVAKYNRSADVYSFGMTCYEVITGKIPFEDIQLSSTELIQAIKDGKRPDIPPACPAGFDNLMSECWAQVPGARPDFLEIQKKLWTIKGSLEQ